MIILKASGTSEPSKKDKSTMEAWTNVLRFVYSSNWDRDRRLVDPDEDDLSVYLLNNCSNIVIHNEAPRPWYGLVR